MSVELVELSNLLEYQKEYITINDEHEYKRCTAKLHHQGIVLRDIIKGKDIKTKKQQVCKAGQLLVAEIDAKVGGYGIVPPELEGAIVSSHYFLFNINEDKLNRLYLHYYLKTDHFFNQIKPQGTTNYASIRPRDVLKIKIPLPSLERQKEIVDKLDKFFKNIELFNIQNKNNAEILNKLRQSILQEAIRGKLVPQDPNDEPASVLLERINEEKERLIKEGKIKKEKPLPPITEDEIPYELPNGWKWVRLGEIGDWGAGATPPRHNPRYYNGDILWLKTGELNDGYINDSEEKITELALKECSLRLNKPGDILIAMYGATIGKLGILNVEATTNQACCGCTPFSQIYNRYLFYLLLSLREEFKRLGAGAAQPNISKQKIINTIVPLPPLNEQKRIVQKLDQLMALCNKLEKNIQQLKKDSEQLMQSVLQETFKKA